MLIRRCMHKNLPSTIVGSQLLEKVFFGKTIALIRIVETGVPDLLLAVSY